MTKASDESSNGGIPSVSSPEEAAQMTAIRKFLFDRSFDTDVPDPVKETAEESEEIEPEEIGPTFSEEEMKAARDEAFAKGKEEGVNEAAAATEQNLLASMEKLNEQFTGLFKSQEEADSSILDSAISVATMIARKIFPALNERGALEEVEHLVVVAMEKILEEPSVTVFVHPDLETLLREHIGSLSAKANYRGEVLITAAEDIPVGDCRVEWDSGGAQRDTGGLWQEIDEIVERNLSKLTESVGETPEAAPQTPEPATESVARTDSEETETTAGEDPSEETPPSAAETAEPSEPSPGDSEEATDDTTALEAVTSTEKESDPEQQGS